MSTTLSTHPPQPAVPQPQHVDTPVLRPTSRPNLVDRLALRLGLWLVTYGRRSYAQAPRERRRHRRVEVVMPDRAWSASWLPRPGA